MVTETNKQRKRKLKKQQEERAKVDIGRAKAAEIERNKPRSRSLAGTAAGKELAQTRAAKSGKVAVFEGGPDKTISEKTPEKIESKRRFDISTEQDKLKKEATSVSEAGSFATKVTDSFKDLFGDVGGRNSAEIAELQRQGKSIFTPEQEKLRKNVGISAVTLGIGLGVGTIALGGGVALATAAKLTATISGIDVITLWFGADNIASGSKFTSDALIREVRSGITSPEEAAQIQESLMGNFNAAKSFIDTSTMINPVLWPFREFYMTGIKGIEDQMNRNTETIESLKGG